MAAGLAVLGTGGASAQSLSSSAAAPAMKIVPSPEAFTSACNRFDWLCASTPAAPGAPDGEAMLALLRKVNSRVNGAISPLSDAENYGSAEYWTMPRNGYGDCEDYAMAKYRELLDAGVGSDKLRMTVVLDENRRNHVVLVVRHDGADLVLDSLNRKVKPWNETEYTYLAMQIGGDPQHWEVVMDRPRDSAKLAAR